MIRIFNRYISQRSLLIFFLESCLIAGCVLLSAAIRFFDDWSDWRELWNDPLLPLKLLIIIGIYQTCFSFNELYAFRTLRHRGEDLARIGQAAGSASLLLAIFYFIDPDLMVGRGIFFLSAILTAVALAGSRSLLEKFAIGHQERILLIGTGEMACMVTREVAGRRDLGLNLIGFLHDDKSEQVAGRMLLGYPVLGTTADLVQVAERERISKIIVAMEDRRAKLPISELVTLRVMGTTVEDAQSLTAALTGRVWLRLVQPSWFVFSDGFYRSRKTAALKRAMDVCLAVTGFLIASPLMALTALCVKLESKGPCLYRQTRVGLRGKPFEVFKFRSMCVNAEPSGVAQWATSCDPRVTRIGGALRKFRLDELPQLCNIIRGEMSFVGPRPERPFFVEQLRQQILYYDERHSVRPGLTGWAQVRFTYGASVEDAYRKLEYDLFYLKHMSLLFDCAILLQTIRTVLLGWERATGESLDTSPKQNTYGFQGYAKAAASTEK